MSQQDLHALRQAMSRLNRVCTDIESARQHHVATYGQVDLDRTEATMYEYGVQPGLGLEARARLLLEEDIPRDQKRPHVQVFRGNPALVQQVSPEYRTRLQSFLEDFS